MAGLNFPLNWRYSVVLLFFSILLVPCKLLAEPEFVFETGPPPWKGERLVLPPNFAPDLKWTGVEHIRFAPGMFEADAPDFFSYILVFLLEPGSDISKAGLEREMLVYYTGLSKAVMGGKNLTVDTTGFAVSLKQVTEIAGAPESATGVNSWSGSLDWIEPFATQKTQRLHLEIHVWEHEGSPVVLSCVSPIVPETDFPWNTLRGIGARFRFEP